MLKGKQLAFRYGSDKLWILHQVDIEIAPSEIVGLSGPSGQGKTTLAKVLAGYIKPTAGRVSIAGQPLPLRGYCPVQLIFQHPELAVNPRWRIDQILHEGFSPPSALLAALSIDQSWLTRWPHELSGGELQRLAVARALGPATQYIIADEMTAMLDANTQAQIWQVMMDHVRQHNLGLLVISHEAPLIKRLCNRVIDMSSLTSPH